MNSESHILIVGAGSIGRRHFRNIWSLGYKNLAICDIDQKRMIPLADEYSTMQFTDYTRAINEFRPEAVFICTPPVFHITQAIQAVEAGAHVFIEKPLSNSLDGIETLILAAREQNRTIHVGYNLRFHPGLRHIKKLLEDNLIGRPMWAHIEVAQYLPDWRPWQDYRQSYTARRELGGGIILDASHEIDYARWLFGEVASLLCMAGKVSDLDVNVEDCATLLLRMRSGMQVDIHLDFVQRQYTRHCRIIGDSGKITWDFLERVIRVQTLEEEHQIAYTFEPNDMYIEEVSCFFAATKQSKASIDNVIDTSQTLQVALLAFEASITKQSVEL